MPLISGLPMPPRPGDTTFSTMIDKGLKSCRARRPGVPLRDHENGNGARSPGLARSRCGLTSKIHLTCDVVGRPLAYMVTGGKANDRTQLTTVMAAIRVPRIGPGRPPGSGLPTCWATSATAPGGSGPGYGAAASATPFSSGPTRSATGSGTATGAGAHRPSTCISTKGATSWNGASTAFVAVGCVGAAGSVGGGEAREACGRTRL